MSRFLDSNLLFSISCCAGVDGFDGPSALVSVAEMGPFGVVEGNPGADAGLQRLDRLVEGFAHLQSEELVQHGAVEALREAVGAR